MTVDRSSSKGTRCSRPNRMADPLPCPGCTIKIWSIFTKTSRAGGPGRFNAMKTAILASADVTDRNHTDRPLTKTRGVNGAAFFDARRRSDFEDRPALVWLFESAPVYFSTWHPDRRHRYAHTDTGFATSSDGLISFADNGLNTVYKLSQPGLVPGTPFNREREAPGPYGHSRVRHGRWQGARARACPLQVRWWLKPLI